ncbi:MAG: hypothetical protein K0M40_02995 [Prolixibacteraceae bacterium]|nr:hypothetical protein [Prolixibacteraceae bacterium]
MYQNFSAIIGGLASVFSLFTFVKSGLMKRDLELAGIEYLKEIIQKSEELKQKEKEILEKKDYLTKKEKEIRELEIKKTEFEFLIQKSSMVLFLKDQHNRIQEQIDKIINDKELIKLCNQLDKLELKINALNAEINLNPNIDLLKTVMKRIKQLDNSVLKVRVANSISQGVISFFEDENYK